MLDTKSGGVFEKQTNIYITETQTESLVAKILAGALEAEGYRCWYHQRFRQPDDLLNAASASDLPTSSHYLVHPALSEYIQKCKFASNYRIIQYILIGENASWHSFDPIILQIELAMEQVADIKLRGQLHQRLAEGKALKLSVQPHSLLADLESIREWRELMERLDSDGYDDVVLWFDELLEA